VHAAGSNQATVRHYYIAAEDVKWDYAPTEQNLVMPAKNLGVWGEQRIYKKTRYIEYTDATFTQKKPQPEHLGILGPVIRGTVGDTIKIHFRNKASQPYSIHPIGTTYGKTSEGAAYAGQKPPGSAVPPGQNHVYTLKVRPEDGPGPNDPSSILRLYRSHVDPVGDVSRGLVGPMIIMRADQRGQDALPKDVDREFVVMFMVFDENEEDEEDEGDLMHTMNGYIFGNLSGLTMDQGDRVRWYLFAMGSEVDLHTPHWHGNGVIEYGHRREVLMLLPAFSTVADMKADNPGTWLFKCNVGDHIEAGMKTLYTVRPYVNASDQTIRVP
tara:strand:+ start:220 stop:1197 length:978 start_codon:yes stop_codon:yes gene_type:complete